MTNIEPTILNRKGARSTSDVPEDVLQLLNQGKLSSVNLIEWLVVDQFMLAQHILEKLGYGHLLPILQNKMATEKKLTSKKVSEHIAQTIIEQVTDSTQKSTLTQSLAQHPSDSVRCWAAYVIGLDSHHTFEQKLQNMHPLAADKHFGVREIAWIALRNDLIQNLAQALVILESWSNNQDENIRRFASESTRPRGVWCAHISTLKQQPELALALLDPLKSDPSKYVRDSVGNWLNDASKDNPDWVTAVCERWQVISNSKETAYIVKRALRTLRKK